MRGWIDELGTRTEVWIGHHIYRSNFHEVRQLRELSRRLGFRHEPRFAFLMAHEKTLQVIQGCQSAEDEETTRNPMIDPLGLLRQRPRVSGLDCELRFNQTTINSDAGVALCCAVYEPQNMLGVESLDLPHEELERLMYRHPFCKACFERGLQYTWPAGRNPRARGPRPANKGPR